MFRPLFLDFLSDTVRTSLYQPALDAERGICCPSHQVKVKTGPAKASQPPVYPRNEYKHGSRTSWKQPRWVYPAICRHGINERGSKSLQAEKYIYALSIFNLARTFHESKERNGHL